MASKTLKLSKEPDDRLSSLPDEVLVHILSLFPTKFAATTSVLSKRWCFLFHYIPHIDLEEVWPINPPYKYDGIRTRILFKEFVNCLLFSPDSSRIQFLRLRAHFLPLPGHELIVSWILAAIRRHVEELNVMLSLKGNETLPTEFFNSTTLRKLTLDGHFIFNVPSSVHMVNLVDLHLHDAEFKDDECLNKGFPALKRLCLLNCRMTCSDKVLQLVSQSLTDLFLYTGCYCKIALHTPNLDCLEYSARWPGFILVMQKLTLLNKADIDFGSEIPTIKKLEYGQYVKKFMTEIHHVKSLRLSEASLEVLCYSTCPLPTFHNLTTMELGVNRKVGWQPLANLLESAPNLEVLHFVEGFIGRRSNKLEFENSLLGIVPICLLEHIREIEIGDFCGKECEFEMVEYFLRKGNMLEVIKICSQSVWPNSFCERLLGYERCSKSCRIVFLQGVQKLVE